MVQLPLMHQIAPRHEGTAALMQTIKYAQFCLREGYKCAQFAGEWLAFDDVLLSAFIPSILPEKAHN